MKIIELHVENFKRLKAVTIRSGENNVVEISGRNAQGKSSAIDAIWAALQGSAALRSTPAPVRKGAEKAEIRLDLGKYVVTRNWTATGNTYLTVTTGGEYKAKLNSPQKLLDNLVGDLCFDPLAFTRLGDKEQAAMVLSLLKLDLGDLDRRREDAYEERKAVNRDISRAKAELDGLPRTDADLPEEPVDVSALLWVEPGQALRASGQPGEAHQCQARDHQAHARRERERLHQPAHRARRRRRRIRLGGAQRPGPVLTWTGSPSSSTRGSRNPTPSNPVARRSSAAPDCCRILELLVTHDYYIRNC